MWNLLRILMLGLLVSGCSSPGPASRSVPQSPPLQGMARVTVERSTDFLYMALTARVRVNGIDVSALSRGSAASIDVQSGRTTVSVDSATSPGTFTISFAAQPNREYLLEVAPRSDSLLPGALFGYVGAFADSVINEQSGLFQVTGKSENRFDSSNQTFQTQSNQFPVVPAAGVVLSNDPPPVASIAERLRNLKKLLDEGLINQKEYDIKKAEIIRSM